jgi:mRNA-degrading endonuclease toxin of MazEF toxin-antitoxin module
MTTSSPRRCHVPPPSRGAVVLVPFRFTNEGPIKHRPAVVLSADAFQRSRAEAIVAAITSNVQQPPLLGDHLIVDWQAAGLPKPSRATAILRTLRHAMVVGQLGMMPTQDLAQIERAVGAALDLHVAPLQGSYR